MELQVTTQSLEPIKANLEDIRQYVHNITVRYHNVQYSDEDMKTAKADRADLRHLKEDIESKRREVKKAWNAPYTAFENEIKAITALIDEPVALIDGQIKDYEARKKEERKDGLRAFFNKWNKLGTLINFDDVLQEEWLKLSVKESKVHGELLGKLEQIGKDIAALEASIEPEYRTECLAAYCKTFNLADAMARQMYLKTEKAKQEAVLGVVEALPKKPVHNAPEEIEEDLFAEPAPPDPKNYPETRRFILTGTPDKIEEVRRFARDHGVKIREIF